MFLAYRLDVEEALGLLSKQHCRCKTGFLDASSPVDPSTPHWAVF